MKETSNNDSMFGSQCAGYQLIIMGFSWNGPDPLKWTYISRVFNLLCLWFLSWILLMIRCLRIWRYSKPQRRSSSGTWRIAQILVVAMLLRFRRTLDQYLWRWSILVGLPSMLMAIRIRSWKVLNQPQLSSTKQKVNSLNSLALFLISFLCAIIYVCMLSSRRCI